jgi:hypothetical protein
MMKNYYKRSALSLICLFCISYVATAQVDFYNLNTVQKIEIYFSQPNWDYQMDTARYGADSYVVADWVKVNGAQFNQAGVKYKGNSSYDSTSLKNPLHIELNHVNKQAYQGFTDIKLSNCYADPSFIREVLGYDILKNYMDCPRSNFATVYINGNYIGIYSNSESINKDFCSRNYNSSSGTFFKCNPIVTPGPTTKSNLRFIPGGDSTDYYNFYELKSDKGWDNLIGLCDTVTNNPSAINQVLDVDRVLWMLAFNTVLVNLDSYTGVFCQNYYIYRDKTKRFNPIVWDLNMAFGGFPYVGSGGTSMGSLTIANMKQLSPTFHATDPFWPLINAVMGNASYKKQFFAHARTLVDENFVSGNYLNTASQLQLLVDSAVQADNNKFFTYTQFQNGMTTDYTVGSYMVPGIANLMDARSTYLQSVPEFIALPPSVSTISESNSSPLLDEVVTITASVFNADSVYFGYRYATADKFERIPMFDDGLHGDLNAGDNIFGLEIAASAVFIEYYIYAENATAAVFSPERAEHEFYTIQTQLTLPPAGSVVINEFLALNVTGKVSDYGERSDWIELYNTTNTPISMYGLYLTDNFDKPAKYSFPKNTTIPTHGYLTIWADEENTTANYLHSNFKLSEDGEELMLSDGFLNVLDSVSFGAQLDDVSYGRCPNGNGNFQFIGKPTFNAENCINDGAEPTPWGNITIFPNPSYNEFTFVTDGTLAVDELKIVNCLGQTVKVIAINSNKIIDLNSLTTGVYFVEFINHTTGNRERIKMVKAANK